MKIELKTKELEKELNAAQHMIGRNKFDWLKIESLDDTITITATDYDNSFRTDLMCDVLDDGNLCIANRKLTDLVRLLKDENITISKDKDRAKIKSGKESFKLMSIGLDMFPVQSLPKWRGFWKIPTALMRQAIEAVSFAIPTSETEKFQMRCANLTLNSEGLSMVTTDGKRIAMFEAPLAEEPLEDFESLVTDRALAGLVKMCGAGSELEIEQDDNHIYFKVDRRILTVRKIIGAFPNVGKTMIDGKPGYKAFRMNTERLIDVLRKAALVVDSETHSIGLKLSGDELIVSAQSVNSGEATLSLEVDNLLDIEIEFMVNVRFVLDFLETVNVPSVIIDISTPTSVLQLRPDVDYKQRYILAPMRMVNKVASPPGSDRPNQGT